MESPLQVARSQYKPQLPRVFQSDGARVKTSSKECVDKDGHAQEVRQYFPNLFGAPLLTFSSNSGSTTPKVNIGVIFSGGQSPGGHNVIAGLLDGLLSLNPENKLYGFENGPSGLLKNDVIELTTKIVSRYRNTGGFDMIGSSRTKIENEEQFAQVQRNCEKLAISGLVIIGGDDSNTNACLLAEFFLKVKANIQVIGCPKTIDGDLKNEWIETSFGFDTACKVYSELIGNICRDALSAKKYWHFIKLMGRSASHIAVECALQTHPNIVLVSEEIAEKNFTLGQIVEQISSTIAKRAEQGLDYGVILIPEGLIEFIPEMKQLIVELNDLLATSPNLQSNLVQATDIQALKEIGLGDHSSKAYLSLPSRIREQLVLDRDPHGNVQVSKIETESLLLTMVQDNLKKLFQNGTSNFAFSPQPHFFGYEGRCAPPSNFDSNYCYGLGYTASALLGAGQTGYIASIANLKAPVSDWVPWGVPITAMMNIERRHGQDKPVIKKALVDLKGKPFEVLNSERDRWALENQYLSPGPIQFFGPPEVSDIPTITLKLESEQ